MNSEMYYFGNDNVSIKSLWLWTVYILIPIVSYSTKDSQPAGYELYLLCYSSFSILKNVVCTFFLWTFFVHDSVWRNDDSVKTVAPLIPWTLYCEMGQFKLWNFSYSECSKGIGFSNNTRQKMLNTIFGTNWMNISFTALPWYAIDSKNCLHVSFYTILSDEQSK